MSDVSPSLSHTSCFLNRAKDSYCYKVNSLATIILLTFFSHRAWDMAVITTGIVGNAGAGNLNRSLMVKAGQHRYRRLVNKEMIPFSELRNRIASGLLQGCQSQV